MSNIKICIGQMEVIPGNIAANLSKALEIVNKAKQEKADLVVLSELCLSGYLLGDMWERLSFVRECEEATEELVKASTSDLAILFGNIIPIWNPNLKNEDGRIRKYNAAIFAKNGTISGFRIKTLQPNYREFDDSRHFYDYRKALTDLSQIYPVQITSKNYHHLGEINGLKINAMLCEDSWCHDYSISPVPFVFENSDIVFNLSCSPYTLGKNNKRNRVFSTHAKQYNKPLVYVNNVGCQNNGKTIYSFDGNSCIYDKSGNQINLFKPFEENYKIVNINPDEEFGTQDISEKDDIGILHDAIIYGTKKYMEQSGIKKVVIGASGGIDSCVVSAIMSKILTPNNILLVNMPTKYNSQQTRNIAKELAKNIGCRYIVHPISESVDNTVNEINLINREHLQSSYFDNILNEDETEKYCNLSSLAKENVQARDRSSRVLAAWAAWFGGCFTCNANKTEVTVGYSTMWGDCCGFLAPIADLWKGQVYELAKYINSTSEKPLIPEGGIKIKPSAELGENQDITKGLGDPIIYPYHDKLFASWVEAWNRLAPEDILELYMTGQLENKIGYEGNVKDLFKSHLEFINDLERWWNNFTGLSVFKRVIGCPIIGISRRCFGFDMRESIVKYTYSKKYIQLKKQILGET